MKMRNMEERNKSAIRKKRENDMEKIIWASRKKQQQLQTKLIFFPKGEKKSNGARFLDNNTKQHNNGAAFSKKLKV